MHVGRNSCYSLNTLDDESSVSTGFRSPWEPNRRPRATHLGCLYIGFRRDLNPVDTSIRRLTYRLSDWSHEYLLNHLSYATAEVF